MLRSPLCIPSIGPDVPAVLDGETENWRLAGIAQGLIDADVLSDADWNGNLLGTINSGLTRWVNVDLGLAADLEHMPFELRWLDDMSQDMTFGLQTETRDGAFILDLPRFEPYLVTVGFWIEQFNRFLPGVGEDILHALCWASESVFNGLTPRWAYYRACEQAYGFDEEGAEEEMGGLSPNAFERLLPDWVISYSAPDTARLVAARDMAPAASVEDQITDRLRAAAGFALDVLRWQPLCDDANRVWEFVEFQSIHGIAIRWQTSHDEDPTGWMMDEEIDVARQTGEISPLVVLIPFDGMENIPRAVEKLAATLRLAQALDDLLQVVHDERPVSQVQIAAQPQRIRIR